MTNEKKSAPTGFDIRDADLIEMTKKLENVLGNLEKTGGEPVCDRIVRRKPWHEPNARPWRIEGRRARSRGHRLPAEQAMISVYVAGSSAQRERARAFIERVVSHPRMCVTHDWVADVDNMEREGRSDRELSDAERHGLATTDLDAVQGADVLVLLASTENDSRGMWVELGFALAVNEERDDSGRMHRITIIVSGGGRRSIFTAPRALVDFEFEYSVGNHDGEAFAILEDLADAP